MTRRALLLAVFAPHQRSDGFSVSGRFERAGADPKLAYFSLGQHISLVLDPEKVPACVQGAEALLGTTARIVLSSG